MRYTSKGPVAPITTNSALVANSNLVGSLFTQPLVGFGVILFDPTAMVFTFP